MNEKNENQTYDLKALRKIAAREIAGSISVLNGIKLRWVYERLKTPLFCRW